MRTAWKCRDPTGSNTLVLKRERQYPILRSAEILLCPVYFNSTPTAPKSSAASLFSASGEINLKKGKEKRRRESKFSPVHIYASENSLPNVDWLQRSLVGPAYVTGQVILGAPPEAWSRSVQSLTLTTTPSSWLSGATATTHHNHRHHGSLTRYSFPLGGYEYGAALHLQ